jgi:hypothetical protein
LTGARVTLARCKPVVIFEFGLGGADLFDVDAAEMFRFFESLGYALFTLRDYSAAKRRALDLAEFEWFFTTNSIWNFVAAPRGSLL